MVFRLPEQVINPHPFIASPKIGGGEEAEKLGFASAFSLGSPSFYSRITIGIY
jgi:hypothetical protein